MIQESFHFIQILHSHIGLIQLHIQPSNFKNVSNERIFSDFITTSHALLLEMNRFLQNNIGGGYCIFSFNMIAEDCFCLTDSTYSLNELQCVEIIYASPRRTTITWIILSTNVTHKKSIFQWIKSSFTVCNKPSI